MLSPLKYSLKFKWIRNNAGKDRDRSSGSRWEQRESRAFWWERTTRRSVSTRASWSTCMPSAHIAADSNSARALVARGESTNRLTKWLVLTAKGSIAVVASLNSAPRKKSRWVTSKWAKCWASSSTWNHSTRSWKATTPKYSGRRRRKFWDSRGLEKVWRNSCNGEVKK